MKNNHDHDRASTTECAFRTTSAPSGARVIWARLKTAQPQRSGQCQKASPTARPASGCSSYHRSASGLWPNRPRP